MEQGSGGRDGQIYRKVAESADSCQYTRWQVLERETKYSEESMKLGEGPSIALQVKGVFKKSDGLASR